MATITKGILGGFSGTVGTVVGVNWRGKDIIRSRPKAGARTPTEKQLMQQMKFSLVVGFLQPLKPVQQMYFGAASGARSRVNLAVSYTISEALQVVNDIPELIYNKVLITKGDLLGFQNVEAATQAAGILQMTWEDNTTQGNASPADVVNVVCYCEELNAFEIYQGVASRADLAASVTLPVYFSGKEIQVWAYMNNSKETQACSSPYLGSFTVQ